MLSPTRALVTSAALLLAPNLASAQTVLLTENADGRQALSVDGRHLADIETRGAVTEFASEATRVRLERSEQRGEDGAPFPVRVVIRGDLDRGTAAVRQEYDLLAPEAPVDIEGLGLVLDDEDPDVNAAEHEQLRKWLRDVGLEPRTGLFEALHMSDTGRALRVWYEIAGRRIDGSVFEGSNPAPAARFDSAFHVTDEGLKIHHARSPFYHRESLEIVDTLTDVGEPEPNTLRSYQCGCYGWAIGGDWVTLGDEYLYHAAVEWRHHRVGAGLFLGIQTRDDFPWIGLADREKVSRLARRAGVYRLTDARGDVFAEIEIGLDPNPPPLELGPHSYVVRMSKPDGQLAPIAHIDARPGAIELRLETDDALQQLDTLFAAMPTQVLRGDGLRDSYLGRVETLVDWLRLIETPNEANLGDVVSEIDALTAVRKVKAMLSPHAERFATAESDYQPLPPMRRLDAPEATQPPS